MDFESYDGGTERDERAGVRLLGSVIARVDGETHIYKFRRDQGDEAVAVVKRHVEEGRLHPYAGLCIARMIRELEE